MGNSSSSYDKLDGAKAKRSIIVTNVPENISSEDLVNHFQKRSNGGSEVLSLNIVNKVEEHGEHRSSFVITFSHPQDNTFIMVRSEDKMDRRLKNGVDASETIESVIKHQHAIGGKEVTVQQYSSGTMTHKTFSEKNDFAKELHDRFYHTVPIILEFILTVPKYKRRIQDMESRFNVKICKGDTDTSSIALVSQLPGCTQAKYEAACVEYQKLYREVGCCPLMISRDTILRPSKDSVCSAEEAVKNVLRLERVVIQKVDDQDKWLFYGEETNVSSAINEVCEMLKIDNPHGIARTFKAQVTEVTHTTYEKGEVTVAKRVTENRKHKLDESRFSIALVNPPEAENWETLSNKEKTEVVDTSSKEVLPLEFVVSGISEKTTEEALINYLENARRSGGGDVEELTFDEIECIAQVKFRNVKCLDQLLGNQHRVDDSNLKVEVKEPEKEVPSDPCKVHVKGLSPATTKDGLGLYMENMSKVEVQNVQSGSYGNALISFKEPIDFEDLAKRIESDIKGLDGRKPILERVPYCCCIQVSGLHDKTTEDSLRLYFENAKRGCGTEPREVDLQGEGRALVYFDDHSVIDKALSKKHILEKAELQMEMFYPFLHKDNAKKKTAEINVEPDIMAHITRCYRDELDVLLDEAGVVLQWKIEKESVVMTEKPGATNQKEPWWKRVKLLQKYFRDFRCERISVEAGVWDEVREAVTQQLVSTNNFGDADITTHDSANEIKITGKREYLQMALRAVGTLFRGIQEKKALNDSIETKVEKDLETGKLALLKISNLYKDLQASNKHLEIEVKENDGELTIRGLRKSLEEISIELYHFFSQVNEKVLKLPERILGVVETPKGRDFVCKSLSQHSIEAVLVHGQRENKSEPSIFATSKEQARQATELIEMLSAERSINLKEENIPGIKSEKWNEFVTSFEAQFMVSVWFEEHYQKLWISGVEPDVLECFKVVESYIERNKILKDTVEVSDGCSRFLFQSFENEIKELEAGMCDAFVKIQPSVCGEIIITGTREGIEKGKELLMSLVQRVCDVKLNIDKPGIKKLFKSSKGAMNIKTIEADNRCTVELVDLDQFEEQNTGSLKEMGVFKKHLENGGAPISSNPDSRPPPMSPYSSSDNVLTTLEGISLVLKVGDISQEKADVLVNTVGKDLNLQNNACARSLSKAAGPNLQIYCSMISPVEVGNIGVTNPGRLKCQHVFHAVCGDWNSGKGEKVLRGILQKCFSVAERQGANSIAIPAIGTGVLHFPRNNVARIFFEELISFSKSQPNSLKEVRIVLYDKDQLTLQAFRDEMVSSKSFRIPKKRTSRKTTNATLRKRKDDWFEADMDELSVQVQSGDITQETTDAIVVVSNPELDLSFGGGAGAAILKAGGPALARECRRHPTLQPGDVSMTSAGKLRVSKLIHYVPSSISLNEAELTQAVLECLQFAEQNWLSSVSFPAIGTGGLGVSADRCAKAMMKAFRVFSKKSPTSVQFVRVIIFQKSMVKTFHSKMKEFLEVPFEMPENPGFTRELSDGINSEEDTDLEIPEVEQNESYEVVLRIYSDHQRHLDAGVKAIREMVNDNCKRQIINNDVIAHIDKNHRRKIRTLERQFDCKIQVEAANSRIILEGNSDHDDILEALSKIHDILHEVSDIVKQREQAELLAKDVQWQYEAEDGFISYSKDLNIKIELEFKNKKNEVTFEENGEKFKINFSRKIEYSAEGETRVARKCQSEISLPDYWDPQPTNSNGSEVTVHLVKLDSHKHLQEYLKVSDVVKKTLPRSNKIMKIQRVQNPAQYKIYAVRKQRMDEKNSGGSNERLLFHGTKPESCGNINANGLNRSYAGRNATLYGQGVYFAVAAKYSAKTTYSPPDSQGNRYMYLARVLTGEYTVGNRSMSVPPPKNPVNPINTYDTVVNDVSNPTIFVAFYDWQCYPEYLIMFQ